MARGLAPRAGTFLASRAECPWSRLAKGRASSSSTTTLTFQLSLAEVVGGEGFTPVTASTLAGARQQLTLGAPEAVLVDLHLPDGSGMDLLEDLAGNGPPDVILITGQATLETAVEALRRGAADYLTKPVDLARVKTVLANLSRTRELKREIGSLRGELRRLGRFGSLIGGAPAMQASSTCCRRSRARRRRCWSWARPAPARTWWPRPSTA